MKFDAKLAITAILSVALLTGCGAPSKKNAALIINDTVITKQQFNKEYDAMLGSPMIKQMGIDLKTNPDSYLNLMLKDKVVNDLIVKTILDNEMKKRHIEVKKDDVDKELKETIDKIGSKDKFNEALKQNGITAAQFKKDLEEEVKIKKFVDTLTIVKITDNDAKKFYNSNLDKFRYPDKVRASHILISADPDRVKEVILAQESSKNLTEEQIQKKVQQDLAEKHKKAERILAEAKKDPSKFAALAKNNSDDPGSAQVGGDLGYFTKDQMVEEFSKAAFSARPASVIGLVKTQFGWHIILVKDRVAAGTEPFDKVKDNIKLYLDNQAKIDALKKFVADAQKNAKIEYVDKDLDPNVIQEKIKEQIKVSPVAQAAESAKKNNK